MGCSSSTPIGQNDKPKTDVKERRPQPGQSESVQSKSIVAPEKEEESQPVQSEPPANPLNDEVGAAGDTAPNPALVSCPPPNPKLQDNTGQDTHVGKEMVKHQSQAIQTFKTEETVTADNDNVNNGNKDSGSKPTDGPSTSATHEVQQSTSPQPTDNSPTTTATTTTTEAVLAASAIQEDIPTAQQEVVPAEEGGNQKEAEEQNKLAEVQRRFDAAVRCACLMTSAESVLEYATDGVYSLQLQRSLPHTLPIFSLMQRLPHLQELDVSENVMGPQAFRALMYAMSYNQTITHLNVANNHTDTDSAVSVGVMLQKNSTLISLNIGGNYLGKDFLSRCIGPALATNSTLQHLSCESVGSVDLSVLMEGASSSCKLVSLNLSHNTMSKTAHFVQHLVSWLQNQNCCLSSLEMKNCGLQDDNLLDIMKALKNNKSLETLNLTGNQISTSSYFVEFLIGCLSCCNLKSLTTDSLKISQDSDIPTGEKLTSASVMTTLSLSGCQLTDNVLAAVLARLPQEGLSMLENLNLSNNQDLTLDILKHVISSTKGADGDSSVQKFSYGHNNAEDLPTLLGEMSMSKLVYLNLRRAKMSPASVSKLGDLTKSGLLETVILDNIKIAGTDCIKHLLVGGRGCSLVALSLADCSLTDDDIVQVAEALKDGLQLTMVKLSSNRIGDKGVRQIVDALLTHATHPLRLMDFSNNRIGETRCSDFKGVQSNVVQLLLDDETHRTYVSLWRKCADLPFQLHQSLSLRDVIGKRSSFHQNAICLNANYRDEVKMGAKGAEALTELLMSISHKTQIHSLNISRNSIAGAGLLQLVSAMGSDKLTNLIANNQNVQYEESDMDTIYPKLAATLNMSTECEIGSCSVPEVPASLTVKLNGLGGHSGDLGSMMDSIALVTDHRTQVWPLLTMASVLEIAASIRGQGDSSCIFSKEEWDGIIDAKKGGPRWLQLADHRERALYMSHLPAAVTTNKMEGVLEMEADCNVEEVVLLKDQLTQKNNGLAWVLLSDVASVERAVQFFNSGEAKVFGQSFMLSNVKVSVTDEGDQALAAARAEMNRRAADRAKEEASHRQLLRQNYVESQARHAYRLANPAYADGRIW